MTFSENISHPFVRPPLIRPSVIHPSVRIRVLLTFRIDLRHFQTGWDKTRNADSANEDKTRIPQMRIKRGFRKPISQMKIKCGIEAE
jgi:hypothetical protein